MLLKILDAYRDPVSPLEQLPGQIGPRQEPDRLSFRHAHYLEIGYVRQKSEIAIGRPGDFDLLVNPIAPGGRGECEGAQNKDK